MTARLAAFLRRQRPALLTFAGLAGIVAPAFIDWIAPLDLSFLMF